MELTNEMQEYILKQQPAIKQLIRDLCAIPAPSHQEEKRAAFCKKWFEENGGKDVYIDEALNVVCPYGDTGSNDLTVFMAHTDTVFPDTEPMPFREEGNLFFCPGVTDDTANLAVLMMCAKYVMEKQIPMKTGMIFVANACEEGLGNLKGCRSIVAKYGSRMKEFITLDGTALDRVTTRAVGSHRYRIVAETEGGHSFQAFGNRNAIQVLATLVDRLYTVQVPVVGDSRTTYNVGSISGGTSVNTIAQSAEMLYEYRSNDKTCLQTMKENFEKIVAGNTPADARITVELIGERPCAGDVDEAAFAELVARGDRAIESIGQKPSHGMASTDCNIPLSVGIPAICLGVCVGGKVHTREEWLDTASLADGCRLFLYFLTAYMV